MDICGIACTYDQIHKCLVVMDTTIIENEDRAFIRKWFHLWKLCRDEVSSIRRMRMCIYVHHVLCNKIVELECVK